MLTRIQALNYIIVPLPSYLLIIYSLIFPIRKLFASRRKRIDETRHVFAVLNRSWFPHNVSTFFILAATGMAIDELVHLASSKQSLGALFFTPIGILLALFLHHISILRDFDIGTNTAYIRKRRFFFRPCLPPVERAPLIIFWMVEILVNAWKVVELNRIKKWKGDDLFVGYKISRQAFDVFVLIGVLVVLLVLEYIKGQTYLWRRRESRRQRDMEEPIVV